MEMLIANDDLSLLLLWLLLRRRLWHKSAGTQIYRSQNIKKIICTIDLINNEAFSDAEISDHIHLKTLY